MKIIDEKEFDLLINSSKKPLVVDFFATWCGPCRMLTQVLEDIEQKHGDKIEIVKVDVDDSFNLAKRFGIMSVPTILLFENGNMRDKMVGYRSVEDFEEFLLPFIQ